MPLISVSSQEFFEIKNDISEKLETKYGKPTTNKAGDQFDDSDLSYYDKSIWEREQINITLVTRKLRDPITDRVQFCEVLIYEFNPATRKKYRLASQPLTLKIL
jgi:hypothetical protein